MNPAVLPAPTLPADLDGVLRLAAQSMFEHFAVAATGMMLLDREHRIVWISEGYKHFLPALGFTHESEFVGRRVEDVVPGTLLAEVIDSDRPILVDLLTNRAGTFVVSRLPLHDAQGQVIGAIGLVLADQTKLQPVVQKFAHLQQQLDDARRQLSEQRRPKYTISSFIGVSPAAQEVKRQARKVAALDSSVLLLGETGTGKELLAHAIHAASPRASKPLVGLNIAAIPDTLLEAELFGVAGGAFTGADRKGREGKFAIADGGTLFLDEIGDMPLALQSKLLRVLQEQEFEPLGSNTVRRVDLRVIAATSRDLPSMVARNEFRADLYYRLAVLPIRVPPLRERREDLEALAEALGEDIARRSGMPQRTLEPDALALLAAQPWPGNIRELRNVLEQASLMSDALRLEARHFAGLLPGGTAAAAAPGAPARISAPAVDATDPAAALRPLPEQIAELERRAIAAALAHTQGNKVATAKLLRISRAALYEKLALYGL
ncbi:sigma-54 interaction domain-containing protein [Inhella proteolytica]|uniref:sigma-54 interaction domain-containing protein n=1 Tax=Inhella proteolytica TaxID=2795029 RepID=UPI0035BFFA5C